MRSALFSVLFALIIHKGTVRGDDFRPTPIPLDEWHPTKSDSQAGTLHEIIATESPPSVAAVPAHYWEDALRHSVYLTLVRDKIDQLIAKGDVISANTKLNQPVSKEIDDHDLWEKIKKAPFDRIQSEEPNSSGDVTIMAKGRLLENKEGFRFAEDERSKENCSNECAEGVKAFWSVKRVRQRDQEISPGKYHYELTFSVISQIPKKQRKPYENPIRTFTVRESTPDRITDFPQEYKRTEPFHFQTARPQRAIWFHKNIAPSLPHTRRPHYRGLDRIFSSLFSDDDPNAYDQPQTKFRSNSNPPQAYQFSKIGHQVSSMEHYPQQSKTVPYPYKPQPYKYVRPPLQAPPAGPLQHHFLDYDSSPIITGNPYPTQDSRVSPSQNIRTTRPAVLPTPVPIAPGPKDQPFDLGNPVLIDNSDSMENGTRYPDMNNYYKMPYKQKQSPSKANYFPEHIRPPVYNAPPGVFVTMDKKPFKPLPPLKTGYNSKPLRTNKPVDFRPSPQVHDPHSPNPDPLFDTAFRPITVNYADSSTTERIEVLENVKKGPNKHRKTNAKKPSKKHENIKTPRITTATPDIITAQSIADEDIDSLDWANILGAFTKTTPMVQTEKVNITEITTAVSTTSSSTVTTPTLKRTTTVEATPVSTSSTSFTITTPRPKKRTRPPPKFTKEDKIKKHKRIISSTTTLAPEKQSPVKRLTTEFTPSSTTTRSPKKSYWEAKNKTLSTSTTTTTTSTTTTTRPTTTRTISTTLYTTSTSTPKEISSTTKPDLKTNQPRNRNRFRQSTLIYKGTSLKHDKWSYRNNTASQFQSQSQPQMQTLSQSQNFRRTSNFQGYPSTTPVSTEKITETSKSNTESPSTEKSDTDISSNIADSLESNSVVPLVNDDNNSENSSEETQDQSEYIFEQATVANDNSNEVIGLEGITAPTETMSITNVPQRNRTRCQKRPSSTTTVQPIEVSSEPSTTQAPSEENVTEDLFQQLFGFNFNSESTTKETELLEQESSNHASFYKEDDDDLTDFMEELNRKGEQSEKRASDNEYDDDDDDDEEPSIDDDDEDDDDDDDDDDEDEDTKEKDKAKSSRDSRYESYNLNRPYSFLELMAME